MFFTQFYKKRFIWKIYKNWFEKLQMYIKPEEIFQLL